MVSCNLVRDLGGEADSYLSHLAYTNCDIFVIVFSISDRSSYDNAIQKVLRATSSGTLISYLTSVSPSSSSQATRLTCGMSRRD